MTKWKKYKLSEIGTIVGGATPSTKDPDNYADGCVPWLTPKDLSSFTERYISKGERSITEKGFNSCSAQMLPEHTVLFSSRAPIGYVAIAKNRMCTNQGFKSVIPGPKVNYLFLYYLLKYKKNMIEGMGSGTTFKEVSGNVMKNIEVCIPEKIAVQEKIAKILDRIDSAIENNNAINRNLSEQCFSIFHHLFDADISNGEFSEFMEYASFKYGTMPKKDKLVDEGYPVFSGYQVVGYYPIKMFDEPQLIIVARGVGGTGDVKYTPANCYLTNLAIAIMLKEKKYEEYLYYYLMCQDMKVLNTGSAQPQITVSSLERYKLFMPSVEKAEEFSKLIIPFRDAMRKNEDENIRLATLRDSLLPKLMSGELDVSELDI